MGRPRKFDRTGREDILREVFSMAWVRPSLADVMREEWYAPATLRGIERFTPAVFAAAWAASIFSAGPERTTCPPPLRLATSQPDSWATREASASSAPRRASIAPFVWAQAFSIRRPRWATSRRPSVVEKVPAAAWAVNSPRERPAVASKVKSGFCSFKTDRRARP